MNTEELKDKLITYPNGSTNGYTLIGRDGLDNIENLLIDVHKNKIQGDFVETGVWKGGACIFAKGVMDNLGMKGKVYVCDSFKGLPPPNPLYPADNGDSHYTLTSLSIPKEEVESYFKDFNLLDDKVVFVEGFFSDTIPPLKEKIKSIAILRLDGDMYESTITVLDNLYDLVPIGGYVIVDDYCLKGCIAAIGDFFAKRNITYPLIKINNCIHYFKKC
jgi:O-methyltransferase